MTKVYIQQGKDPIKTTIEILKKANLKIKEKVLIKPNITMPFPPKESICTSPKVIEGVVQYLRNTGIKDIVIGEGAGGAKDMSKHFEISGYKELSDRLNVPLINLNKDRKVVLKIKKGYYLKQISIAKTALGKYVINVPKMKTHRMLSVTLAAKNLMGFILPYDGKKILHPLYERYIKRALKEKRTLTQQEFEEAQKEFFKRLVDFYSVFKPDLNIIDAFGAREGNGLTLKGGKSIRTDYLLLSKSVPAIDYVAAYLMGFNLSNLYLKYVKNNKINSLKDIEIISNIDVNQLRRKFNLVDLTERIEI